MAERTDFLYPFLDDQDSGDPTALLDDLAASAAAKAEASAHLRRSTVRAMEPLLREAADAMVSRFAAGGRLFTFGNGGSSTDADSLADLFARPPSGRCLPARCLVDDQAVLTALGNDVGFDLVFGRQIIAHAAPADIAIGISTSGNSRNVLIAFEVAASRGLLTLGLAGYDGGEMARSPHVAYCLTVEADSIHRIQESQAALGFALWESVQARTSVAHG
jgi:D-sedoheptulose 7-phosphate isomerase